jgi:hypothetical protein
LVFFLSFTSAVLFFLWCKTADADVQKKVANKISGMRGYEAVQAAVRNGIVFLTSQCEGSGCAKQLEENPKKVDGVIAFEKEEQRAGVQEDKFCCKIASSCRWVCFLQSGFFSRMTLVV